jgi:hypothetical protein
MRVGIGILRRLALLPVVGRIRLGGLEGRGRGELCLRRGRSELLLLTVNLLTALYNLGDLVRGWRRVRIDLGLRGSSSVLAVREVLALVRLNLR